MIKLGVNVDHIATVRQARVGVYPDPVEIALLAEEAGAKGITIHLREDRRHIQLNDVFNMKKSIKTKLNLEMATDDEIVNIACDIKPHNVCLVPEKREELTTEGGLDVIGNQKKIAKAVQKLKQKAIIVSIFIDPIKEQILAAKNIQADAVEIHTGRYADAKNKIERNKELLLIQKACDIVLENSLILNAGHGLNYANVKNIAQIPNMNELNIGHSIISYSFYVGIKTAVKKMIALINSEVSIKCVE
ncbi:pyridoxine 5'-phosphate synthase [bacterium]